MSNPNENDPNHPNRSGRRALALVAVLSSLLLAPSAHAAIYLAGLLPHNLVVRGAIIGLFNGCVNTGETIDNVKQRDGFLSECCGEAEKTCRIACGAQLGGAPVQGFTLGQCNEACEQGNLQCSKSVAVFADPSDGYFESPIHPGLFPDRRIDFCREDAASGGVSCGAPAAHAFCELQEGAGFVAASFAPDGIPATADDPTWKLGLDPSSLGGGVQCETPDCQGFAFIECVDATTLYAVPSRLGLRVDECYLAGSECGQPAADAFCALKEGFGSQAASFDTEGIASDTLYLGEPPISTCDGPGCTALRDVLCFAPQLPVNIDGDVDLDGVRQFEDNCEGIANPLQRNADGDTLGDACDPSPDVASVCDNGVDDDGDGLVDDQDPGCLEASDTSEHDGFVQCDDGLDNDLDGDTDLDDADCTDASDAVEAPPSCGNGIVEPELGEVCDDGNGEFGDGCNAACRISVRTADVLGQRRIHDAEGGFDGAVADFDGFGSAVAGIGDFDGDGVEDVVASAPYADTAAGDDRGALWIILLHADGSVKTEYEISHRSGALAGLSVVDETFGVAATSLGDVDGDGITDLAVGAPGHPDEGQGAGAVYVLLLNADATVKSTVRIGQGTGGLPSILSEDDRFGSALARIDDLDGNGVPELAVGSPGDDDGGSDRGSLYVLFLASDGTVDHYQKVGALGGSDVGLPGAFEWGHSLAFLGDLDGDGIGELATSLECVAAEPCDFAGDPLGQVMILFLNADGSVRSYRQIDAGVSGFEGPVVGTLGVSLANLGDLDGDGLPELGVGDLFHQNVDNGGQLHVLFLTAAGTVRDEFAIDRTRGGLASTVPATNSYHFGVSAARLGDLDGDGIVEVAVGASGDNGGGFFGRGAFYVLSVAGDTGECADGIDNDDDGFVDLADATCDSPYDVTELPEPGAVAMLAAGIAFLGALGRRRMRR